ncbi:MAG: hypothetical protein AAFR67_10435, partial [Chloroflexota bacterium]
DKHWRGRPGGKPFFAQIQLRGGKNSGKGFEKTDPAKVEVPPYYPDHPVIRSEIAHHYDTIRQTDAEVGKIIAALKEDGLLDMRWGIRDQENQLYSIRIAPFNRIECHIQTFV